MIDGVSCAPVFLWPAMAIFGFNAAKRSSATNQGEPVQRSPTMGNGDLTVCMAPPISGRDVYGMGRPSGGVCMTAEGDIEAIVNRGRTPIAAIATSCCSGNCSEPRHIGDEARNDRSPNRLATRRFSHRLRRQSWRAEPPVCAALVLTQSDPLRDRGAAPKDVSDVEER